MNDLPVGERRKINFHSDMGSWRKTRLYLASASGSFIHGVSPSTIRFSAVDCANRNAARVHSAVSDSDKQLIIRVMCAEDDESAGSQIDVL